MTRTVLGTEAELDPVGWLAAHRRELLEMPLDDALNVIGDLYSLERKRDDAHQQKGLDR